MELNELLERRAEEIEDSLQDWIKPHLGPGEKLKVTLAVVYNLLDLAVEDFFSRERVKGMKAGHSAAARIHTAFVREAKAYAYMEGSELTLRRFLKVYTTGMVRGIFGISPKSYEVIVTVLNKEGFHLRGPI